MSSLRDLPGRRSDYLFGTIELTQEQVMQARDSFQDYAGPYVKSLVTDLRPRPKFRPSSRFLHDEALEPIAKVIKSPYSLVTRVDSFLRSDTPKPLTPIETWERFVAHYSTRSLTFPSDKLLAIAGVAKMFSKAIGDDFVAGLWQGRLERGLLWYIRPNTIEARPPQYRAPTWSWASVDGYVMFADQLQHPWNCARIITASANTFDGTPYGVLQSAKVAVEAFALSISLESETWHAESGGFQVPTIMVRLDTEEDTKQEALLGLVIRTTAYRLSDKADAVDLILRKPDVTQNNIKKGKILLAAQGIIVVPIASSSTNIQHRRIGYFSIEDRKSGKTTPNWTPAGCRLFREPYDSSDGFQARADWHDLKFPFEDNEKFLREFEII
jgi:hypothetical protein